DPIELAGDMRRMVDAGSTHLVMEVSSHALHQKRAEGIHFSAAAFTNLSHDHLDYHSDMQEYAAAKKMLFDCLDANAKAVINVDDEYAEYMASNCAAAIINFSFESKHQGSVNCEVIDHSPDGTTLAVGETQIESPLIGDFNAYNIAQSFLLCKSLGYQPEEIAEALKTAKGAPGRIEKGE